MTNEEKNVITNLSKCDFTQMSQYFKAQAEARKQMSKEEKLVPFFKPLEDFGIVISPSKFLFGSYDTLLILVILHGSLLKI